MRWFRHFNSAWDAQKLASECYLLPFTCSHQQQRGAVSNLHDLSLWSLCDVLCKNVCPHIKGLVIRVYICSEPQWLFCLHGLENHVYVSFTVYRCSFPLGTLSLTAILPYFQEMYEVPVMSSGPKLLGIWRALPLPQKIRRMAQLQVHRLSDGPASSAPSQISLLQQVWADSWLDQFVDGTFSKENPGAGGRGVSCFLHSACSSDWSWCSSHPALGSYF